MQITINGKKENIGQDEVTLPALLLIKGVKEPETVSVEHNGALVKRNEFESTTIKNGDTLEFLYFIGGGINEV